jgi:hypothetical protein
VRQSLALLAAGLKPVAASVRDASPEDSLIQTHVELQVVLRLLEKLISSCLARFSYHGMRKERDWVEVSPLYQLAKLALVSAPGLANVHCPGVMMVGLKLLLFKTRVELPVLHVNFLICLESQRSCPLPHLLSIQLHEYNEQVRKEAYRSLDAKTLLCALCVGPRYLEIGYDKSSCKLLIRYSRPGTRSSCLPVVRAKLIHAAYRGLTISTIATTKILPIEDVPLHHYLPDSNRGCTM